MNKIKMYLLTQISKINDNKGNGILRVLLASLLGAITLVLVMIVYYISYFGPVSPVTVYHTYGDQALMEWRDDLRLSFKNGIMTKNISGPIYMWEVNDKNVGRATYKDDNYKSYNPEYIIAIDETKSATMQDLEASNAMLLFAKDGYITKQASGEIRLQEYKFDKDIDKQLLLSWRDKGANYVWTVIIVFTIAFIITYIPSKFMITLIWNAVLALILLLIAKINGKVISFDRLFKVANYLAIPAIIIDNLLSFTFLYSIIVLVVGVFLIVKNKLK